MARKPIKWHAPSGDVVLIQKIVERGMELIPGAKTLGILHLEMDITACHLNGTPLRLEDLLNADDFNFAHDVGGIVQHLDRRTGKLDGRFLPRFAQSGEAS